MWTLADFRGILSIIVYAKRETASIHPFKLSGGNQ